MLYAIAALLVIIVDQATKIWASSNLKNGDLNLIPGLVVLKDVKNDGAAFSFLAGKNANMIFIIVCAVFAIFVIIALATKLIKAPVGRWSLVFIMAGGISNCIDRVLSDSVQDMIYLVFLEKLSFLKGKVPIFNVADIFITVFCLVFILFVLFGGKHDDDYEDEDEDEDEDDYEDEDEDEDEEEEEEEEEERGGKARGLGALFRGKSRDDEDEDEDEDEQDEEDSDDEDEEDEEDEAPRGLFAKLRARSRERDEEDEDEDEEEEEEEPDEEDEEEDDLPPARRPSRYDRAARNGKRPVSHAARKPDRVRDEEEEEDEEEEADEAPVLRRLRAEKKSASAKPKRTTRRDRQAELDEKYARFKAERAAREQQWSAPEEEETPVVDPSDPFAEWDAAARKADDAARAAEAAAPAPAPAPEVETPAPAPAPQPAPSPKAEAPEDSMEFSLEDILAEFK